MKSANSAMIARARQRGKRLMENFWIELFVRGGIVCLLTAFALLLFRRTAAAYRHLMCVLALCVLPLLPFAPRYMPSLRLLPPQSGATPQRATVPTDAAMRLPAGNSMSDLSPPSAFPQTRNVQAQSPAITPADSSPIIPDAAPVQPAFRQEHSWQAAFFCVIWGLAAATLLIRLIVALFRLRRLETESRKAMLGSIPILVGERVKTPLTWGVRRSVILLPAALLSGDPVVCDSALRHEQAHIARQDWIWNLLAEIVCALCWFQPGAWWLRRRMRLESERACDDRVLLSGISATDYAAHLLEILRSSCTHEVAPAMAQSGRMEERMRHILDARQPRHARTKWLAVAAPCALTLLSLAALRVSARPAGAIPPTGSEANVLKSRRPAMSSRQPDPALSKPDPDTLNSTELPTTALSPAFMDSTLASTRHSEMLALAPSGMASLKSGAPQEEEVQNPAILLKEIIWGKAVDGLQSGFWLTTPGLLNNPRVPFNSLVSYRVLVRNTTDKNIAFIVRLLPFNGLEAPYLIPSDNITEALDGREVPQEFRARGAPHNLDGVDPAYAVTLAPGEAVLVPGPSGLYVGDADSGGNPGIAKIKAGMNWLVQPVTTHLLTPAESAEAEAGKGKINLTIVSRDGRASQRSVTRLPARSGGKTLYARIQLEVGTLNAEAARNADKAVWGKADKGLQCGIRLLNPKRMFQVGDTLEAELLWRNTSDAPITTPLPRTLDLYPSIHDAKGRWLEIDFGPRFEIYPISHTFERGEVRSLGVTAITLVARETPSPKSNKEPGHITLPPGTYKLSGSGGVSAQGGGNPTSGEIEFQVVGGGTVASKEDGIFWGEKAGGFQLGARLVQEGAVFKVGDTIKFQAFGRNLSGKDVDLSIGNYWKVNYKIQVQTLNGSPVYMERDGRNQADQVAGYRLETFSKDSSQEISEAMLKIVPQSQAKKQSRTYGDADAWVEVIPLKPGRYRVRLLSWGIFGTRKLEPMSGWIPIEVKKE